MLVGQAHPVRRVFPYRMKQHLRTAQRRLGALPVCNIAHVQQHSGLIGVSDAAGANLRRHDSAIAGVAGAFDLRQPALHQLLKLLRRRRLLSGRHQFGYVPAHQILPRHAMQPACRRVDIQHAPMHVLYKHGVRRAFEKLAEALFAVPQRLLRPNSFQGSAAMIRQRLQCGEVRRLVGFGRITLNREQANHLGSIADGHQH